MPEALGKTIDELYAVLRSGGSPRKHIVFIVGNGILPVANILNDDLLKKKAGKENQRGKAFAAYKWRHFEYARFHTATALPSFAHCCIRQMVEDGLCQDVITTNYDQFFDTIWDRSPHLGVVRNPVLRSGEYDWEGFYSPVSIAQDRPRYWKIHGSLSHVCFRPKNGAARGKPHLYRLPRFAVSINNSDLAKAYGIPTQAPFMGYEASVHPNTEFWAQKHLDGQCFPYIDWTYESNREFFKAEIEGAKRVLSDPDRLAAVVLLGFSGYYGNEDDSWNEELVPELSKLRKGGFTAMYMAVHVKQYKRRNRRAYRLLRELDEARCCYTYQDAAEFMKDLVYRCSSSFPYEYVCNEYERWRNQHYLTDQEAKHS